MTSTDSRQPGRALALRRMIDRVMRRRGALIVAAVLLTGIWIYGAITAIAAFGLFLALTALLAVDGGAGSDRVAVRSAPSREPEAGFRALAESLPDPCFFLDRHGIVRHANSKAVVAFNVRASDSLIERLRVPDLTGAFERVAGGGPPEQVEFVERIPTERWFIAWLARLDLTEGQADDMIVLVLDDLTEVRRTDRIRVDFVANASHELRTPLASLAGFVETLQGSARNDEAARERFLEIMKQQADRMSRLIDDLLSLSRIEMKAHVQPTDEVDLSNILRHVTESLDPLAKGLEVRIETVIPATPVPVTGDRDELIQVFSNLIENGCKYGQSGRKVVVTVAHEDGGPVVTVRDYGPGIPEEHLPRLTERFYRIDVEVSRRHRGTGLGLAIVKHVLARHQARMTVTSTLGEGAAFRVAFPLAKSRNDS